MSRRKVDVSKEYLQYLYWDKGLSLSDIGKRFHCTHRWILHLMKKYGVERRTAAETYNDCKRNKKISESLLGRYKGKDGSNWNGGSSSEPYCHKFNFALKERVREKHGRKCCLCGKTEEENGQRLCVHHVDEDKMQGCDDKKWYLIPLCRSCHTKTHRKKPFKQ